MRAVPASLASFLTSRAQQFVQIQFFEFGLTNGLTLRYCTYPGTIVLQPPTPPGGYSALTVDLLGGSAQVFGSPFVQENATFSVPTVNGLTIVALATNPGLEDGHIVPPVVSDPTGQVTWSQRKQELGVTGNAALILYSATTTGAPVEIEFGNTTEFLGIVGRMSIYVVGIETPEGGPVPSFDTNTSFAAASSSVSSPGVGGISGLSTDSTYPMMLAFNVNPDNDPDTWTVTGHWHPVEGVQNIAPAGPDNFAGTDHAVGATYYGGLGQLTSATVTPFATTGDGTVAQNCLIIDAIANNAAPPAPPPPTTWIGTDIQITSGSGGKSPDFDTPAWSCKLGGTADQMELMLSWFPAPTLPQDQPQSVIGTTPWPVALRLGFLDNATITMYTAFWPSVESLLLAEPPIGYGDIDPYGNAFDGLVNMFEGRISPVSDFDRQSGKVTARDGRMLLDVDFPRDVYQGECLHTFCDAGCTLSTSSFTATGTMTTPTANSFGYASTQAPQYYQFGQVSYTDPVLEQTVTLQIVNDTGSIITVSPPMPTTLPAGTAFSLIAGCDKKRLTCKNKFSNLVHYLGFDFVPSPPDDNIAAPRT